MQVCLRWWGWFVGLLLLLTPTTARADDAEVLLPVKGGVLYGRDLRAGIVETGLGGAKNKIEFMAFGRAGIGPDLSLGWGGVRIGLVLNRDDRVQLGLAGAVSAGGGKYRKRNAGLLAAAEPGLFARILFERLAVQVRADWYQPLYMRQGGVGWGALGTIAILPRFDS